MKTFLTILFALIFVITNAQTPFTIQSGSSNASASRSVASLKSAWAGGTLVKNLKGDISQNFDLSGFAMYTPIYGDNYAIPFMTNVNLGLDSLSEDNGVLFGMYPYYSLLFSDKFQLLAHGGIGYKFNNFGDESNDEVRMLVGLEMALYGDDSSPITISIAPEFIWQTSNSNNNTSGLSMTAVIPVANQLGAMIDGTLPFGNAESSGVKVGIILRGQVK